MLNADVRTTAMKIVDNSSKEEIKAHANVAFSGVSGSISASGDVEKAKESLNKSTEITISAKWEGGGQIKEAGTAWSIDELIAVGARFPELCAKVPQTSFVVLKKYVHLASFHEQVKDISPLSYENAAIYTDLLMDNFLDYKMMLKQVNNTIEGLRKKTLEFDPTAGPPEVDDAFRPTVSAMVDARGDILLQCSAINQLVDDITAKPDVILTFNTAHRPPYMDATRWQLRLPPTRPVKVAPPVSVLDNRIVLRGRPAILAASDNTHDVFAQGTDGFLWHKATAPGQPRGDWLYQGDNVPLSSECSPCAAAVGQQRKYCFVVGADSRLYYKTIGAAADAKWTALAEPPTAKGIRFRGGLAAISRLAGDGDDAVVVVAVGADARPYWALVSGADGATWTAFAPLRGASLRATPPVLVRNGGAAGALVLVAVDADHRLVANVLPGGGAPAWTGWTANAASYVSGDEVAASWPLPVDQDWATQIDVLALGESRRRSYEFQLVHGAWRDAIADFGRDWLRSAVGFASLAPGRQEYFAVAGGGADGKDLAGALWQTSWNLSKSTQPAASWHRVADGPFRATMPVVVPISDDDVAVYVVTAEGKLIRLVTSAGSVAEVERV